MVRRIRILVLLLVSGVSVAASGADNSVSANDESHSSLPDLASESAKKEEQENKGKTFKEQGADYFINSATQGFDNLTPEALESQARGYIQGQVTSSAQSYLEGMLSPYGKVRTSLSIGEGGDLDGSSLDYFIPWYDNQSTLFFSQISAQRKEDRTIGNVGLGVRQNVGNWLLGGNAFYDYDFTRGHRRLGLGTEAWTDYLKFSGNYYHPLSDWKDSKDFDFYEERPARGWDIRMESWLPFYPQLGAKLVYEQYYGDEVALFGTDNLQKDPHAVTVGLNYTPVPLVTVGTDYKAGTGDSNDFSVNATVNYQIGTPLAAQLDPENVKIQHSLMGSRTDFVDRNNFIVLEYREKDPLDVTLWLKADATNEHPECVIEDTPEAAVGLEKCKWTVNALINHHYKIISASWQAKNNAARTLVMPVVKADALTEGNNNRWNLVLPAWVNADTQANGPGVKTPLVAHPSGAPALKADVDVIFTTLTSPDSGSANMYGHMADNSTATVDGESYTFSRPKLAAETDGEDRAVSINNESWAQFNWANADKHCDILPDARQLEGLKIERGDLSTTLGWPVGLTSGDEEYWSSSQGSIATDHISIDMRSRSLTQMPDATQSLVSCVDKASPAVTPKLVISADSFDSTVNAAKVEVGDEINMKISVTDSATNKPLPYRYFNVYLGDEQNRQNQKNADIDAAHQWSDEPVVITNLEGSDGHYHGVTDANGQFSLALTQDRGAGVLTPVRVVLFDGTEATQNVIFTVVTSPDVAQARMWGHMQGVVEAGNIYKRPLLADEAAQDTGSEFENNEYWATFNSVTAATNQCGAGQVPGQLLLDTLYAAHSGNAMETTYGWPTQKHSYIAADTDGSTTAHVNLATGADSMFSGAEPNYLSCSGNELVTILNVYFDGNESLRNAVAKVGEQVTMNVHSVNALNGLTVPNAAFTVTMSHGKNRDNATTGFTDSSDGTLVMGGTSFGSSQASMTYQGITDAEGNATLVIEQPQGVGLLTPLTVLPLHSLITAPVNRSVKFTVPTSPDTPKAHMWGHMADTLTVDNMEFQRPKLAAEATAATRTEDQNNETWARVTHADALNNPDAGGCEVNHLPQDHQLSALYTANDGNKIHTVSGWPTSYNYWSSTFASASSWQTVSLASGDKTASGDASDFVSCLVGVNPTAASITIEPVDTSLWYDVGGEHAVKVKKGDTLQLKVTAKDASGNPVPDAPFVLSRGDGYTRQGEKHIAGSGDGIVSAVVIDGESLNDTATKIGELTGEDGSKIITVTRPDTHGTKVAITAALYDNASATASIDTIFTVVTSPDSDKAKMWGHMPETVAAANGEVFKRPLLSAEIASGITHGSNTENNETWGSVNFEVAKDACGAGFVPSLADLQSLYDAWPGGAMNTQQGWPLDGKNYQDSTADLSRTSENRYVKSINLRDGGIGSLLWDEKLYFVCLQNAHPVATQITLTSPQYNDSDGFAKAKVGETIPVTITTLDAQGNPVADTPVIFTRGDSIGRANQEVNGSQAAAIQINHSDARNSGVEYYTATGADGTLTLDISQDGGAGFKTPLMASIEHSNAATTAPLPVIFTVVTSPDTPKASYWGHMAETLTDSSGVAYKRPLLASEFSATPGKTLTIANGYYDKGETWGMITVDKAWNGVSGGCGRDYLPSVSNLQTLYNTWPDNAMRSRNGWPMTSSGNNNVSRYWWAGDYVISSDGAQSLYAAVNLFNDGNDVKTTTSTTAYYMQTCLVSARRAAASLTLTLAGQDEATGIAKAKKGEQIAATVTVKDAAGQPMKNVMVKISRGTSYNRANSAASASGTADDITLRDVMPSGLATSLLDTSAKYLYVETDELGQVTFTLAQDSTTGLKTTISAATMDGSNLTDSKDAIFTVVTSPDSDKAKYWGHMPETFTNSKGVEFKRPLLRAELSSTADTSGYTENNESWYTWSRYPNMYQDTASPCDRLGLPTVNDLQTLYTDYPNGALTTTLGLPVASGKYWGGG